MSADLTDKGKDFASQGSRESESDKLLNYGSLNIRDHFSLKSRGSRVEFVDTKTVNTVWPDGTNQYVIEDDFNDEGENEIQQIKLIRDTSTGLVLLRATYTLVCLFWTGFLLVCSLQLLVYLVLDLLIQSGATEEKGGFLSLAIGTFLAFPIYINGLANIMVIAGSYVSDTWNGQALLKEFVFGLKKSRVKVEWLTFLIFLGLPALVMCGTIFIGREDWWEITSLFWLYSIGFFYFIYATTLITTAVYGSFVITKNWRDMADDGQMNDSVSFWETLTQAIETRNHHYLSGLFSFSYITEGAIDGSGTKALKRFDTVQRKPEKSLWTRFVSLKCMNFFFEDVTDAMKKQGYNVQEIGTALKNGNELGKGIELFDINEVQGSRPFLTEQTWSLEKIFCRDTKSRYVVVFDGPDAVTASQMKSSVACFFVGHGLGLAVFAAALTWLGASAKVVVMVVLAIIFSMIPKIRYAKSLADIIRQVKFRDDGAEDEDGKSIGLFQIWRSFRVRQPKRIFCILVFGMEFVFFFLWPLTTLYYIGNYKTATLFFILGFISFIRSYFDPAIVLEETNQINFVSVPDQPDHLENKWSDKQKYHDAHWTKTSRLIKIINTVNRSDSGPFWRRFLTFFLIALVGLFTIATATKGREVQNRKQFTYLQDFYYDQEKDLPYPTCKLGKGALAHLNGNSSLYLTDYLFVAGLAYSDTDVTQPQLDQWFGEGNAKDNYDYVQKYRMGVQDESSVSYKLISFNRSDYGENPMGLISIRGTVTAWDALTDIQLWSAAAVFQILRGVLPGGQIWTPILHHLVNVISWLASESINRVAFYKETTAFAKALIEENYYDDIQVTGHSLGGGLAIITGAQSNIPAIALSGPNAMIGRDTFSPPVTAEALNTMTFNVIPDRDIVPRFDDRGKLFQEINCLANDNDLAGCHTASRSLCEVLYTCGTMGRPALCECHTKYGYPVPKAKDNANRTFEEACSAAGI